MKNINEIINRSDVFYWQADRKITDEEAGRIWIDKHQGISNDDLITKVNSVLSNIKVVSINKIKKEDQTNLGNVNSIRTATLDTGEQIIIRCHPKGVPNGYFFVESLVTKIAREHRLPTYQTFAIHELENSNDIAFQVIEKMNGTVLVDYIANHPTCENTLIKNVGKQMANLHKIEVSGFGPFDNNKAKEGVLVGIHKNLHDSMCAGLDFNINFLLENNIITSKQAQLVKEQFSSNNLLFDLSQAVLIHNDFADWNLLTDGKDITAILDWDECVAGDPIQDIACWSSFFDKKRLSIFLEGYFSVTEKPNNFEEKLKLYQIRYTISKQTLRVRRYKYNKDEAIKNKILSGQEVLKELLNA